MISNQVLDFHDDQPKTIFKKIASKIPQEVLAKELTPKDAEAGQYGIVLLTKEGSALSKFPISNEADTAVSALYFEETRDRMPYEAQRIAASFIKQACDKFKIAPPEAITKLASDRYKHNRYDEAEHTFATQFEKKASVLYDKSRPEVKDQHFYALPSLKKYAMPNADYLKKAEAYFEENHRLFTLQDKIEYSLNTVARAEELGVQVENEKIHKYASSKYGRDISSALKAREPFCKTAVQKNVLKKMASFVQKTPPREFAEALHLFDKKAGLDRFYDSRIQDPYLAILDGKPLEKFAGYSYKEEYTGHSLSKKELEKAFEKKSQKIADHYGKSLADGLKKEGIAAFEALPDDAKDIVAKIAVGAI
jgi:hypothetical protein